MKQIADDRDAEWESDRDKPTNKSAVSNLKSRIQSALKKKESREKTVGRDDREEKVGRDKANSTGPERVDKTSEASSTDLLRRPVQTAKPRFIEPMKPRLVDAPPTHGDWLYELKFDGIRLIAIKEWKKVKLISRNKNDLTARFAELVDPLEALPAKEFVIDGEVVAVDDEGALVVSIVASARNGESEVADLLLCFRSSATEWQRPNEFAVACAESVARETLC